MLYFELKDDMADRMRHRWHIGEVLLPNGEEPWLTGGIWQNDLHGLCANVHHVGQVLECCHTTFGVPLATRDLANAICAIADGDVQIIPVTISNQVGMMVLNAIRVIACVDETSSRFEKYTNTDPVRPDKAGDYRTFEKLVLARSLIPADAHFFRVKGYLIQLIVSETVKNAMERVGCYGAEFTELEMA